MRDYAKAAKLPLIFTAIVCLIYLLSYVGYLPSHEAMLKYTNDFVKKNGPEAVFIVSVLENTVWVNSFFPGAIAILTAMALTNGDPRLALLVWIAITAGAAVGLTISFYTGRIFSHKHDRTPDMNFWNFIGAFFHPFPASIAVFNMGVNLKSFREFFQLSMPVMLVWYLFWGFAMYFGGNFLDGTGNLTPLVFGYLFLWLLAELFGVWRARREKLKQASQNSVQP